MRYDGVIYASAVIAQQQCDAISILLGYPKKGVNVGGGLHVTIPSTFSSGAPGWTEKEVVPLAHPTLPQFAVLATPPGLTVDGQQTTVGGVPTTVALSGHSPLPPDWEPPGLALGQGQGQGQAAVSNGRGP